MQYYDKALHYITYVRLLYTKKKKKKKKIYGYDNVAEKMFYVCIRKCMYRWTESSPSDMSKSDCFIEINNISVFPYICIRVIAVSIVSD